MGYFLSNLIVYAFIFFLIVLAYYAVRKLKNKKMKKAGSVLLYMIIFLFLAGMITKLILNLVFGF